jgi:ribosomal protein L11 methyltransferase
LEYKEIDIKVSQEWIDILVAELGNVGCESFIETEEGVKGYVTTPMFEPDAIEAVLVRYQAHTLLDYQIRDIAQINWNLEWEKNFEPVLVEEQCHIRADFHEALPGIAWEVVINPKMSFGTGHHATTYLMVNYLLKNQPAGLDVLDAGCGTGVLAILAKKMGSAETYAYDNSDWAVENARENAEINGTMDVRVLLGEIAELQLPIAFDLILANINRNVLLAEIPDFAKNLKPGGKLVTSGYFSESGSDILQKADLYGLQCVASKTMNNWMLQVFTKP